MKALNKYRINKGKSKMLHRLRKLDKQLVELDDYIKRYGFNYNEFTYDKIMQSVCSQVYKKYNTAK